jgi:hypothetical protein
MGVRASVGLIAAAFLTALILAMIMHAPIAASQVSPAPVPSASSQDYSFASQGLSCSGVGDTGYGSCFATGNLLGGGYGYGGCIVNPGASGYVPSVGMCYFLNESFAATFYFKVAGNGQIVRSPISGTVPNNPIPVISDVINTNNKFSPYLITCPVSPQPTNSIEYISDPGTFIAGNRCLASILPLLTSVSLTTQVVVTSMGAFFNPGAGGIGGPAPLESLTQSYSISGFAKGSIKNLGFSGQTSLNGGPYNLSGSYNTKSYIFQPINSSPQQGLWTWTADYANLNNINLGYLHVNYDSSKHSTTDNLNAVYLGVDLGITEDTYIPTPAPIFVICSFPYTFVLDSKVTNLANANVPIPIYNTSATAPGKNYLKIGQYIYSPVKAISNPTGNACFKQMLAGGPGCKLQGGSILGTIVGGTKSVTNWLKIGTNATAYYGGQTYNNLPVYLNASNSLDINRELTYYGAVIGCQPLYNYGYGTGFGFYGGVNGNPTSQVRCKVVIYIPQVYAQDVNGNPAPTTAASFIADQLHVSGSGLVLTRASSSGGGGFFGGGSVTSTCSSYTNPSMGYGLGFTGSYNINTANTLVPGYNLNYCVTPGGSGGGFSGGGYSNPVIQQQICRGAGLNPNSCALYVGISSNPINSAALGLSYMVPINSGGTQVLLSTNSITSIDFANVLVFPYFTYNATIPSTFSQFTPASYLNLSYAVYSPNNYASTTNAYGVLTTPVEPYNLFSGSGLLANYSDVGSNGKRLRPSEMVDFPISIAAGSSNTYYDEFPVVVGGLQIKTSTVIPLSTATSVPAVPAASVTSPNSITPANLVASLNLNYPANTIVTLAGTTLTSSDLDACSADFQQGGSCFGDLEITGTTILQDDLFVFGNINIDSGATLITNGYSIITSGTVSPTSSVLARPASVASITDANLDEALAAGYPANSIIQVTADIDQNSGLPACPNDIVSGYCLGETNFTAPATLRGNLFIFGNAINIEPGVVIQTDGYAIITNGVVSDPGSVIGGYKDLAAAVNNHGTLGFTNITNPAFITETPNGFIYIINYSASSGWAQLGVHSTTTSYLFKLKYIPTGDYNYSVYQPKQFTQQTKLAPWMIQAQNYFRGSLLVQTPSLYVLSASLFSQTSTPNWCLLSLCIGSTSSTGSSPGPFLPMAAQADYQGDLFLVGAPLPASAGSGTGTFTLGEVSASGVITVDNAVSISGGYGFVPSDEMTVSPGGEYVYLANASFPNINIYSTKGGTFTYVGNIPLSYSNSSYNMNIIAYLAHGGPYNNKNVQTEFQRTSRATTTLNDISTFHRPMKITDVGGTLFVLDAWTFGPDVNNEKGTNSNSNPSGYTGSIWMLRAFEAGGNNIVTELPIGYSSNKTIVPTSPVPQQVSPFAQPQTFTYWPPYGWPLTENLSFESQQYWTICEYNGIGGCNAYGSSPSGLSSVGPQISLLGTPYPQTVFGSQAYAQDFSNPTVGISSDFAGDIYLLVHDSVAKSPYTELLELKPQVENYTRLDIGTSVPFQCYFSNAISTPDCMTANFISGLYPPLLAMPDSFEFLSGQGSELQYFNIPSGLSSLLPVGAKVSPNTATEFNTGNTGGSPGLYNCLTTNSPDTCGTVGAFTPTSQLRTYINGLVAGYVITPYTITYTNKITYGGFGDGTVEEEVNPESAEAIDPNLCDYTPDPSSGSKTFYKNVVTQLGSSAVNQTIEGGSEYANYYGTQNQYQPNLSDQSLIMPPNITYSMFSNRLFGEIYINQTISPTFAGSISTQLASYLGSSLGSLGSVLSSFTGMGPKVLNATRNYNYAEDVYIQVFLPSVSGGLNPFNTGTGSSLASWSNVLSTGGCSATNICAPAFLAENAIPTNVLTTPSNTLMGANCGGSCPTTLLTSAQSLGANPLSGLPSQVGSLAGLSGYYYSSLSTNYLPNNNLTYSATSQTSYFPLFTLFKRMASTYTLGLNLSNTPQIYGYNRLLYTYVDRFNNTIYMPVDVDFANTTMLTLDTPSTVNTLNVNQTQITINGILLYLASNGIWVPPPVGSTVYLYYNTNINFYNTSAISMLASSAGGIVSNLVGYYKWADICAFAPEDSGCVAANPLSTFGLGSLLYGVSGIPTSTPTSLETLASSALESLTNTVTYSPNYASSGQCAPQPNSLLSTSQYNCNLYGSSLASLVPGSLLGLPATATGPNGNQQYCVPAYTNGTGTLTSQLGLIGTAATDSSGGFNAVITACGTGSGRIVAQFYGSPSPEPINIAQTILPRSVTPLSANTANDIITPEYNYGFAPNETSSPFQIGSYQLSLGNFYAWIPIIIILILLLASKSALGQSGGLFELFGFSTLASMASGIGAGAGTKGIKMAYRAKQNAPNPIFDRYDDYKKAQGLYKGAGGKALVTEKERFNFETGKMEKTGIYTTSVLTFAAWVKAGMPAPTMEKTQFPTNLDQVTRINGINLTIDRSNFYTFLGLSRVPPDRETAQRAAATQQRMLNMQNPNDPNLDAKKKALGQAAEAAEHYLKPAAAGGGLVAMSTATQYWQKIRRSGGPLARPWTGPFLPPGGMRKEATEVHFAVLGASESDSNERLLQAYHEKAADLEAKLNKSLKDYKKEEKANLAQLRIRAETQSRNLTIETRKARRNDPQKLSPQQLKDMKANLVDIKAKIQSEERVRPYWGGRIGDSQVWRQERAELKRSWKWVKKERGIVDAPPPPPAPPPPAKPPPLPPQSAP